MQNPFSFLKNLPSQIDAKISKEIDEKSRIATHAVVDELPDTINDLLDGKPVQIVVTVQLKRIEPVLNKVAE